MPNVKVSQRTGKKQRGQANRKPARKDGANACRSQPGQRRSRRLPQARPECLGPPADSETAVAPGRPSGAGLSPPVDLLTESNIFPSFPVFELETSKR